MLSNRSFCNCLFVSVRVFPISQTDTKKEKEKKYIIHTYLNARNSSLRMARSPYKSQYNLIRKKRLISPIIIRARLELDLIKSCVSNTKDQFVKSIYDASPIYSLMYIYPYMYIYNIFCLLIYIYISNPTKFYIPSLVYFYSLMVLYNFQFFLFFFFFVFSSFFFSKLFDIRHANLRVSYDNFILDSLLFLESFCSLFVWLAVIYNRGSQPNDFAWTLCVAFIILAADSAITNHSDDYKDPFPFFRTISHSLSLSVSVFSLSVSRILNRFSKAHVYGITNIVNATRSRRFTPLLSHHRRRRCHCSSFFSSLYLLCV